MSKHLGRRERWSQVDAKTHLANLGKVAYQEDGWYALFEFRVRIPQQEGQHLAEWQSHSKRLGPFKRPRNAMVALERELTVLRNRHGSDVLIGMETSHA